ncbi:hypothetical protein [Amycolatopsis jejuensis]|uniref:hypothetical protein n=1 Tax=Amycolatopsis jejuensis TaxID=330084 RepID=UPI0005256B32|nr:hypothetical protein [Amycolatopsis jejuensis]
MGSRFVPSVVMAVLLVLAMVQPAAAAPSPPPGPPEWQVTGGKVVWTAPKPLFGDAGVEFWSGGRLLGRAQPAQDQRTFSLPAAGIRDVRGLEARVGGQPRQPPPAATSNQVPAVPPGLPASATDPGKPGHYETIKGEYSLDPVRLPGLDGPIEMQGVVVAPKHAVGVRPLVLFLHGRHAPCYYPDKPDVPTTWPCPVGSLPIPSHRGYLQTQELLASQGYVTVSIAANAINALDFAVQDGGAQARSSLVRRHLARWADWSGGARPSAPGIVRDAPIADLSNVLLAGHSRGGEGVNRAALDSLYPPPGDTGFTGPVRWKIRGTVLIAPTAFGMNPAPDVPSVTLLPACDGDVADLQGQQYIDAARGVSRDKALHSALYIGGANHNYFNAEWTPGLAVAPAHDDMRPEKPDPNCSPGAAGRLTDAQQRAVGATYVAAAAHLFQEHDLRVQPLLDGSGVRAPSADPAHVFSHALGGARKPVLVPGSATQVSGSADVCRQVGPEKPGPGNLGPEKRCLSDEVGLKSPHFVGLSTAPDPTRTAVHLRGGGPAVIRLPGPVPAAGARALTMRIIAPQSAPAQSYEVAAVDPGGRRTALGSVTVTGLPGRERAFSYWGQEVRVPLPPHLDLAGLEFVSRTAGAEAWLLDAYTWRPGLPDPDPAPLTRVDLGTISVDEGDSGEKTYRIPVTVTGDGGGDLRVFRAASTPQAGEEWTYQEVSLAPGQHTVDIPATITGNTRWSSDYRIFADVKATRGVVVGAYEGDVNVRNDDRPPKVTVSPASVSVAEGGALTWHVALSEVADAEVPIIATAMVPASGPELLTTDVDPEWLKRFRRAPLPAEKLSDGLQFDAVIPAGSSSVDLVLPTLRHAGADPAKHVKLHVTSYPEEVSPEVDVTGTVTDAG